MSTPPSGNRLPDDILARISAAGLRRTLATRVVLGLFVADPGVVLTHAQVLALVQARGLDVNRVTLYRLLDRLAACGALQRETVEATRTWRFRLASAADADGQAPRFECDSCHQRFRLDGASASTRELADSLFSRLAALGHQGVRLELAVHGTCAGCADPAVDAPAP